MIVAAAIQAQRSQIVAEALSWVGTPWRHAQAVKGVGVDCAMLLRAVYEAVGLGPYSDPRPYPKDWFLHRDEERMLAIVSHHAREVTTPGPGDVALYRFGRCASHAAIIENEEMVIHADVRAGQVERCERASIANRLDSYWSVFG